MSHYKLIYFNFRGRAEVIRLVFAQAGVDYVDERVNFGEEWETLKPKTPFGVLPVLEVGGKMLGGSAVIARYVAEKHGVAGSNEFENAFLASIVDANNDIIERYSAWHKEKDPARKAELKRELDEEYLPPKLHYFQKLASGNNSVGGWLYGPRPTYADFAVYTTLTMIPEELVARFRALAKLKESVEKLPNIAKWIKERPVTTG